MHKLIKDYKRNTHQVIHKIYQVSAVKHLSSDDFESEKAYRDKRHKSYKSAHEKFSKMRYKLKKEITGKVHGKVAYEKNPDQFDDELNLKIKELNHYIKGIVQSVDYNLIRYSESSFRNMKNLSYNHNDLIEIVALLCEKFPALLRIIQDKYDCILIDEYQDTGSRIIEVFLEKLQQPGKTVVGLFGDSMQSIYDEGVENVDKYVKRKAIERIRKEDNYRCSPAVIDLIATLRNDGLKQKLALKLIDNQKEKLENRVGKVKLFYSMKEHKIHGRSSVEGKHRHIADLNLLIKTALVENPDFKILMLTNKSISKELNFPNLYQIFADRYTEPRKEIEECLDILQLLSLCELCDAYQKKNFNFLLTRIKAGGRTITSSNDKLVINKIFEKMLQSKAGAMDVVNQAIELKVIKRSDKCVDYFKNANEFLEKLSQNVEFQKFKQIYKKGATTLTKYKEQTPIHNEEFTFLKRQLKKEHFYNSLFDKNLSFQEILNFYKYHIGETKYSTMHKTKGTGIENVLVVFDNFFWNKYNFNNCFYTEKHSSTNFKSQKLAYVACSRAQKNLICVKIVHSAKEEEVLKSIFTACERVELP